MRGPVCSNSIFLPSGVDASTQKLIHNGKNLFAATDANDLQALFSQVGVTDGDKLMLVGSTTGNYLYFYLEPRRRRTIITL